MEKNAERPLRVGLISLGCAKNLVDAEIMLGSLLESGVEVTNDAAQADALIVNTCSFIDAAQEESVDAILESSAVRDAQNREQALIVSGCLPQRFRDDLPRLLPEVDAFMGIDQVRRVGEVVQEALARRAQRIAQSKAAQPKSREQVRAGVAKLDRKHPSLDDNASEARPAAPGSDKTKKTKIPGARQPQGRRTPAPALAPLVDVSLRPGYIPDYGTPRFRLTPKHFAYVKIAEGCNHPCSFCIIPRMRGAHRSRRQDDIVAEARQLIAEGVRELNLISQDSTYYGLDLRANHRPNIASPDRFKAAAGSLPADATTLCTLLRELSSLEGDFWIRLLYTHPAHWTDELIETIAGCPKMARYVDMPLQHIHENMLQRMRRETSQEYIVDLIRRIRAGIAGIALRTTFIVGFPGETEASFEALLNFVRETRFERLGVFTYSKESGTRAASMGGQIAGRVKQRRRGIVMAEQHKIAREISSSFVGRTIKVLVEKEASASELERARVFSWEHGLIRERESAFPLSKPGSYLLARGEADAPDIDGRVYVRGKLAPGAFAHVKIVGHTDYDLIAEPA